MNDDHFFVNNYFRLVYINYRYPQSLTRDSAHVLLYTYYIRVLTWTSNICATVGRPLSPTNRTPADCSHRRLPVDHPEPAVFHSRWSYNCTASSQRPCSSSSLQTIRQRYNNFICVGAQYDNNDNSLMICEYCDGTVKWSAKQREITLRRDCRASAFVERIIFNMCMVISLRHHNTPQR